LDPLDDQTNTFREIHAPTTPSADGTGMGIYFFDDIFGCIDRFLALKSHSAFLNHFPIQRFQPFHNVFFVKDLSTVFGTAHIMI
jgi:hypothetical protein